ncbi:MAG: WbuC family cupin fold metalloprotein [Victivallales bacterium]|nr:WbuC family cupin fold metalloprotein [Victivallales bacterium]
MIIANQQLFSELSQKAIESPRKRSHYNFHPSVEDDIHRLCMAAEPDSYVRPHRHSQEDRWELFIVLKGAVSVLIFTEDGVLKERYELEAGGDVCAVEIEQNVLHSFISKKSGSIVMEVKRGPYIPIPEADSGAWAPREGEDATPGFLQWMRNASPSEKCPAI